MNALTSLEGIIYYPKNWNPQDKSRCLIYHNPNGTTVGEYFVWNDDLSWTPKKFRELAKCPIILYDYRGTGLSSENHNFQPTCESIIADGEKALQYALNQFQSVDVVGSSLGAGVATASLDRHLKKAPEDCQRVRLFNHDSFSTTPRVLMPNWPTIADWGGWAVGALLEAKTPMKNLIQKEIPITVLCHLDDPVIPKGARMAEYVAGLPPAQNVSILYSPDHGHANLSSDMIQSLTEKLI